MPLAAFLISMVTPLVGRILLSLGFSVVTVTGMTLVITTVRDQFLTLANQMPADMLNVFLLAGGGVGFGMLMGAVTTRVVIRQIQNSTKFLGANPQ